ncbi:MAG: SusC/RagA family TonB-linked outer membrane protein [Mangrovibacterium sp.]
MRYILFFLSLFAFLNVSAQTSNVSGVVTNATTGETIPGASVVIKGTTQGTITDIDGQFVITAKQGDVLQFSFVGMLTNEAVVNGSTVNVQLTSATTDLEQVIVVGYGVQKKSVVTASIASVSADQLKSVAPTRVDNALKGLAAGVTVTQASGQPGEGSQIRIRGIGTINNSDPLYIVDGMPIDGGIDYLNPNDIQSIEVLKDAASGAVYGARAANGVILVTTKSGSKGKIKVSYDFSYGWQSKWKKRDVLNGVEYATLINEGYLNSGQAARYANPASYGEGTDWQDLVFNDNAPVQNHQFSVSGGSDKVDYYFSGGYFAQDGIVGGNYDRSNYERMTLRSNTTYRLLDTDDRNFLNKVTAGINVSYSRITSTGISTNSEFGSPLGSALALSPLLGLYAEDQAAVEAAHPTAVKDPETGLYYTIPGDEYNEMTNPVAALQLPGSVGWSDKFISNFFAEINLWDNLKFRSSFGTDLAFYGDDGWTPEFYLNRNNKAEYSSVSSNMNRGIVWQLENVLSYEKSVDKHNIQAIAGQSAKKSTGRNVGASRQDLIEENPDKANIDFATGLAADGKRDGWGAAWSEHTLASLFARVSYNYDERYMLQATVRRDGSSNFGSGQKYGIFPSVSLGWNLTNEGFMESRPEWLSATKVRASWGRNGNESIGAFGYTSLTSSGNNYTFGSGQGTTVIGTKPSGLANQNLHWEESEQIDLGVDFGFFDNTLTFTTDYYVKNTNGMLMTMTIPSYVGESKPTGNVGDMRNSGWEFELGYRFSVSDFNFNIRGNAAYLKNELIALGNSDGFANYDTQQGMGTISRAENGLPFPFFYGRKTDGIFQNQAEINSYVNADGELLQSAAKPGDVRFVDIDKSGTIDDSDRTMIGKGMPDWTYGLSLGVDYKGFDLSVFLQGTVGNDIFDASRRTDISYANLPTYMLDRWTGEGTSNTIPRFTFQDDNQNWTSSDMMVKDGSYMRVKNVTLGYTLPSQLTRRAFIEKLRVYVMGENLFTFTKYEGFDPEISSGGTSLGVDKGVYPQARVLTVGASINF